MKYIIWLLSIFISLSINAQSIEQFKKHCIKDEKGFIWIGYNTDGSIKSISCICKKCDKEDK